MSTGLEIERLAEDLGPVNKKPEDMFEPKVCVCQRHLNYWLYHFIGREQTFTHLLMSGLRKMLMILKNTYISSFIDKIVSIWVNDLEKELQSPQKRF